MKKIQKIGLILLVFCLLFGNKVFAESDVESKITSVKYTKEYTIQ